MRDASIERPLQPVAADRIAHYRRLVERHEAQRKAEEHRAEAMARIARDEAWAAKVKPLVTALGYALDGWELRPSDEQDSYYRWGMEQAVPAIVLKASFLPGIKVGASIWDDDDSCQHFDWQYWSDLLHKWGRIGNETADAETAMALAVVAALDAQKP